MWTAVSLPISANSRDCATLGLRTAIMKQNCEYCINYIYDEEYDCMACAVDLDEDEYAGFITSHTQGCPYYRAGDDYTIVRKQN